MPKYTQSYPLTQVDGRTNPITSLAEVLDVCHLPMETRFLPQDYRAMWQNQEDVCTQVYYLVSSIPTASYDLGAILRETNSIVLLLFLS